MNRRNKKINQGWDELDDLDSMFGKSSSSGAESLIASKKDSLINSSDIEFKLAITDKTTKNKKSCNEELVADKSGKKRRRSVLQEEGNTTATLVMGYSQRNKRLSDGQEAVVDDAEVNENKTEFNRLFAKGVYLLGMREHSIHEMENKLNAKSDSSDIVLAVIDELIENNFLSDERFAESYVRSRCNKGFGPVKIRSEFHNKGISNRLAEEYIIANSPHWIDVAREQYEKKYALKPLDNYKEWTKRARFMQGRGFTMEHIQAVMPSADFY